MLPFPLDRQLRPLVVAFVVFLFAAGAATTIIQRWEQYGRQEERTRVFNLAADRADALRRNIEQALSATYALAALVRQGNGSVRDFDAIASQMLPLKNCRGRLMFKLGVRDLPSLVKLALEHGLTSPK